jgi:hypothetical protein
MRVYFQNKVLIVESENDTEDLALEYWREEFFKKVDYNKDIQNNPFFFIVKKSKDNLYEQKTEAY